MNSETSHKNIESLLTKLLTNYTLFFSKDGLLNSEGRKLFELIARLIIAENPERKGLIVKVRKNPTLENVIKVAVMYMDEELVNALVRGGDPL